MMKRFMILALGAAMVAGISGTTYAQTRSGGSAAQSGIQMNSGSQGSRPSTSGTTGQGGPGASEFAPGRNPGTASENNPGHDGTPPGQQMHKQEQKKTKSNR